MGIYLVFKNEFLRSLKSKKKLIITLLIPIMAVLFSMGINSIMKPSISLGVIDNPLGNDFKEKAESIRGVKVKEANEDAINSEMILGKYSAVIELTNDNLFKVKSLDSNFEKPIQNIVDSYVSSGEVKGVEEILDKMEAESLSITERAVGFMVLTLMITSTIVACNLIRDKEEGTLKRFNISPRNRFEYILGIYLYNLLFTFVQISIAIILVSLLPMSIGINTGDFLILGAVISFIASSFGLLIACLSNEELKASLVSSSVAMILALFGGAFIPIGKMPDALQRLSNGSIVKWLIEFTKSAKNGFVSSGDWIPIIIISLMALAGILLSIKTSRRKFA